MDASLVQKTKFYLPCFGIVLWGMWISFDITWMYLIGLHIIISCQKMQQIYLSK